ncbi:MAG: hypothetical protein J3K34DRAFT_432316 [Monoraphidium minutum]|nr:MAG: hypothetical protein J3K34DRAFT_432316 [Monoraphidium minutum]
MEWYSSANNAQYNSAAYAYSAPPAAAYGNSFEDEPPLLEELGIDLGAILRSTRAILLHQMRSPALEALDAGGALMFMLALGGLHLLMGKVHFGVILGWSVAQSVVVYFVANQVASNDGSVAGGLDLYSCCCVTGYGMVPLIVVSAALLLVPKGPACVALSALGAVWSAITAAKVLARMSPGLQEARSLMVAPCLLMYGSFALLGVY